MTKKRSKIVKYKIPCSLCGSSDALTLYDNGLGTCFSCGKTLPWEKFSLNAKKVLDKGEKAGYNNSVELIEKDKKHPTHRGEGTLLVTDTPKVDTSSMRNITTTYRGLTPSTFEFYGVMEDPVKGEIILPYGDGAYKARSYKTKNFYASGSFREASLFGMDRFNKGSAKAITITEGEIDAMSVFQMLGSQYPSISIKNGAASASNDCEKHRDYINSFEKIYLCFDNDQVGRDAQAKVAAIFDPNKVYIVDLTKHKDANDYLTSEDQKEFQRTWWNAKRFRPKNIISGYDEVKAALEAPGSDVIAHYPFPRLDEMSCGIQEGQVVLVTAPEKIGKTEFLRAIEYHLLKTTDYNLGIIHLEEKEKRAIQGLVGYELKTHVHRPDSNVTNEEQFEAYLKLTKRDDRVYFYQHFGSEDPDVILDVIRNLVTTYKCKFIFLDHITMLATGFEGDDERRKLDYISTRLAMLTRELNFTLFLVSHVNDDGKTRGSRNISKICSINIFIDRNKESPDPNIRNTINVMIRDNRDGSDTGPSAPLRFDRDTFTISEIEIAKYEDKIEPEDKGVEGAPMVEFPRLF